MAGKGMRHCCDSLADARAPHLKGCQGAETVESVLREARKWIAGRPDILSSSYSTSFAMLDAIDRVLPE